MSIQTEIDFSRRGEQLRLLDRIQFGRGLGCSPGTLKATLVAVDSFAGESGWCFASAATIGQRANFSDRTIRKALAVLHGLFLVRKQQRVTANGSRQCRYQVVWSNVHEASELSESTDSDDWEEVDHRHDIPNQRKEIPNQRNVTTEPTEAQDRTSGTVCRVTAIEPQITSTSPQRVGISRCNPHNQVSLKCEHLVKKEEGEILEMLSGTICRSEALRLSRKVDQESAEVALAEYRHPANRRFIRGPGALVHRLDFGEWPDTLIRTLEWLRCHDATKTRQRLAQEAARAEELHKVAKADQRAAELEAHFGPKLDAMSKDEIHLLARGSLDEFSFERFLRGSDYRQELLDAIRSTENS